MRQTALITGATSGIGKAYAARFAQKGYDLILTGRREKEITEVARALQKSYGIKVSVYIVDFSKEKQRLAFLKTIKDTTVDALVNNAGYGAEKAFTEDTYEAQQAMMHVHMETSVALCHSVSQQMKVRRKGIIINVSSLAGYLVLPNSAMYCATKAFLSSFTQSLALELRPYGIQVQVVCPGFVHTDFHEKLGINQNKCQSRGPVRWMSAEALVQQSLIQLDKHQILCIPGKWNQVGYQLLKRVPKRMYYAITTFLSH